MSSKPEPSPPTLSMLHRTPAPDCPLCGIWGKAWVDDDPSTWNKQHVHAEKVWRQWARGGADWPERVCQAAAELSVEATPAQARAHYALHGVEQPALSGQLDHELMTYVATSMHPRLQAILTAVYRQRLMTTNQVREIFYASTRTQAGARKAAKKDLLALAQAHFLYRYLPPAELGRRRGAPPRLGKQAVWLLGKAAVPYIESVTGDHVTRDQYVQMAKEIGEHTVIHDLRTVGLYAALHKSLREHGDILNIAGQRKCVIAMPENWYGPKHLAIGFDEREVRPDGFFSLSLPRTSFLAHNSLPSCQLPCFLEYDRGTRDVSKVIQQLFSYHLLARSRRAGERFPDLNVAGYAVPVVMVFSDRARMEHIHKQFKATIRRQTTLREGAPIFLVCEEDWLSDPFAPICLSAWHDEKRYELLELLVRASKPLIRARACWAEKALTFDNTAARAVMEF